jgi:hypothetical protein
MEHIMFQCHVNLLESVIPFDKLISEIIKMLR